MCAVAARQKDTLVCVRLYICVCACVGRGCKGCEGCEQRKATEVHVAPDVSESSTGYRRVARLTELEY